MTDESMEPLQVVKWHCGIQVVLGVVVHLPVKKPHNPVHGERPAAQAKVRHEVLQTIVLGIIAQEEQPPAVERRKGHQNRLDPLPGRQRKRRDQTVPDAQRARPPHRFLAAVDIVRRIQREFLITFEALARDADLRLLSLPCRYGINKSGEQEVTDHQADWQNNLQVVGRMQCVAVMPRVAALEDLVVDPPEKGERTTEKGVEPPRLENRAMSAFVEAIDQKRRHRAVKKNECLKISEQTDSFSCLRGRAGVFVRCA